MKRFWLILLSLGLIVAFSTSAMAVDVKFSGEYYAAGMYLDKTNVTKNVTLYTPGEVPTPVPFKEGPSTAFYFQRLRVTTQFIVAPGLTFISRFDAMERAWGASRTNPVTNPFNDYDMLSAGTKAENENIAFDLGYISYVSPIGVFNAGYQIDSAWGTVFGDNSIPVGKVGYMMKTGNLVLGVQTGKNNDGERSYGAFGYSDSSLPRGEDMDSTFYTGYFKYFWKGGDGGLLIKYINNRANRVANAYSGSTPIPWGQKQETVSFLPYFKAQLGPVALQAEVIYTYGKAKIEDEYKDSFYVNLLVGDDQIDVHTLSAWIDATADFGMVYAGGSLAYVSGDDYATKSDKEGSATGGLDWNPCLIMFNSDLNYWVGSQGGYAYLDPITGAVKSLSNSAGMYNAYFAQLRGGIRPVDKLDIMASVSWAKADKTPGAYWDSREYGYEVDLTGTYKITNNLSYMLGAGYWFVGDFYKGQTTEDVNDNFMVINKLTLTF